MMVGRVLVLGFPAGGNRSGAGRECRAHALGCRRAPPTSPYRLMEELLRQPRARHAVQVALETHCGRGLTGGPGSGRALPDKRFAYITCESIGADPGAVDVIDLAAKKVVASVSVPAQPTGITILGLSTTSARH